MTCCGWAGNGRCAGRCRRVRRGGGRPGASGGQRVETMPRMGAENVSRVFTYWTHLPDRAFRALSYMALVSIDQDMPPRYFGGYLALARILGREVSADPVTDAERRARKAAMESVRVVVRTLLGACAIVVDVEEAPGRGPEFSLLLDALSRDVFARSQPVDGPGSACRTVQAQPADGPGSACRSWGGRGGTQVRKEDKGRNTRGSTSPQVSSSLAAVENVEENDEREYEESRKVLEKLPDLGITLLGRTDPTEPIRGRVIRAAKLHREQE